MLIQTQPDQIQSFLSDSSYVQGGHAERVVFPKDAKEAAEVLEAATREHNPVTVSGAGTGTVGGRVPFGGIILATDKLDHIKRIVREDAGGLAVAEAGVILSDLQQAVNSEGLLYPPDPTERGCFLGGNVATNASGSRTFKYGPTRNYVQRLTIALAGGDVIDLHRGELFAAADGRIRIPLSNGREIEAQLPSYSMPRLRKHASGYFVAPGMDIIDLFIGSEGTLGVVIEVEVKLLPKPEGLLSGVVFFASEEKLLTFVSEARERSLHSRQTSVAEDIDARALEFFDSQSLGFLRQRYETIPSAAVGAIFFEQETTPAREEALMNGWLSLLEEHDALAELSWFATNEPDQARLREFRHQLPVLMNEWFARHNQRKVSTDMSVPDKEFSGMLRFYEETLQADELRYTIFGHIGDNHVHVNILPRNDDEGARAREIYVQFLKRAAAVGGTLSAEHGVGKLKREYLQIFHSEQHLREMAALKRAFDPAGILGRGNIFAEEYL
ncbi:MAG: D-lactate dehydrogenase (cytochrome) [Acidobacteria bacterium]|nr:D-lactate dehydrogenase (cytochrome) [Acidobacteriota bacterium]